MEVNNTFTSLIADLPYPNTKVNSETVKSQSSEKTSQINDANASKQNPSPTDKKENDSTHVNILV